MNDGNPLLIVGAGPSGLTLATELTRRGIACVVIDKAPGPAPIHESRALAFNARSQSILATSVTEQIMSAGHSVDRIRICWQGNLRREVTMVGGRSSRRKANQAKIPGDDPDAHTIVIIRQGEIERLLIKHLQAAGVTVQWNTELIDFVQSEAGVTANLKTAASEIRTVAARYIAGCDGAHSEVRKQGGYTFDGESDSQIWTLADATVTDRRFAHSLTADLRTGQAFATVAIEDNVVRLIHNGPDILSRHPVAKYCTDTHWESEFRVSYRLVKRFHRGRTFLCGDAAHIHSPVGGRGMNLGIEDAATLAWLLEQGAEDQYSSLRLPAAKKVLKLTYQQTSQMNSSSVASSLAKKYGPKLMAIPAITRSMKRSVLGLDTPGPAWLA